MLCIINKLIIFNNILINLNLSFININLNFFQHIIIIIINYIIILNYLKYHQLDINHLILFYL